MKRTDYENDRAYYDKEIRDCAIPVVFLTALFPIFWCSLIYYESIESPLIPLTVDSIIKINDGFGGDNLQYSLIKVTFSYTQNGETNKCVLANKKHRYHELEIDKIYKKMLKQYSTGQIVNGYIGGKYKHRNRKDDGDISAHCTTNNIDEIDELEVPMTAAYVFTILFTIPFLLSLCVFSYCYHRKKTAVRKLNDLKKMDENRGYSEQNQV